MGCLVGQVPDLREKPVRGQVGDLPHKAAPSVSEGIRSSFHQPL
jgi:hypothetical protein